MTLARALDERGMRYQRQGRLGFYLPASGEEGLAVGSAYPLRADDWLGSSGPGKFAIVMVGPAVGGRVAADRLVAAIAALGMPGLSAAAGIAPLTAQLTPGEALRRGTVTLTAIRL